MAAVATAPDTPLGVLPTEAAAYFEPFALPTSNQRQLGAPHAPGSVAPLALRPSKEIGLDEAVSTISDLQKSGVLTSLLSQHGALLFRGVPVRNPADFSRFAHSFGYAPHEIIGLVVERGELAPNVSPANESAKETLIFNHNESPQVPHAPEYIFFYGHRAPKEGGETPVSSSLELFRRAQEEIPEFIEQLAKRGVRSSVTYKRGRQYAGGTTMQQAFGKEWAEDDDEETKRRKVEDQIRRYGRGDDTTWEWTDDGGVIVTHVLPAIRTQPGTGLPVLFTGLAAYYRNLVVNGKQRYGVSQTYGDGEPIPEEYIKRLAEITDEITVLHKWQEGDLLVYDNVITQHGRHPWKGEQSDRVVYASLFDGEAPGAYGPQSWAKSIKALDG